MNEANSRFTSQSFGANMRTSPTFSIINGTGRLHRPGVAFYNLSSIDAASISYITMVVSTNYGANLAGQIEANSIAADAEL